MTNELRELLHNCRSALKSLPEDALGQDLQYGHFYRDELVAHIDKALATPTPTVDARAAEEDAQQKLNRAVMYALREGCFFPVPEPQKGASVEDLVKWGAMRGLHDAIAEFNRAPAPAVRCAKCGKERETAAITFLCRYCFSTESAPAVSGEKED